MMYWSEPMTDKLHDLIATAHFMRAKQRAKRFAAVTGKPFYIFATPRGLEVDPLPPQTAQSWHVATPTGEILKMRRKV
jgi:hypothetical protein